jgi:hypothetical protein
LGKPQKSVDITHVPGFGRPVRPKFRFLDTIFLCAALCRHARPSKLKTHRQNVICRPPWIGEIREYDEKEALVQLLRPQSPLFKLLLCPTHQKHECLIPLDCLPVRKSPCDLPSHLTSLYAFSHSSSRLPKCREDPTTRFKITGKNIC